MSPFTTTDLCGFSILICNQGSPAQIRLGVMGKDGAGHIRRGAVLICAA